MCQVNELAIHRKENLNDNKYMKMCSTSLTFVNANYNNNEIQFHILHIHENSKVWQCLVLVRTWNNGNTHACWWEGKLIPLL